jgi:hypothetical protein
MGLYAAYQSILACDVTDATNDKQQAEPLAQATLLTLSQAGIEQQCSGLAARRVLVGQVGGAEQHWVHAR